MPILEVELVEDPAAPPRGDLARRIADAAGAVFGSDPGTTWVKLGVIPAGRYAENGAESASAGQPVFVKVLKWKPPEGPELEREIAALSAAIAEACERPLDRVHVLYQPPGAGRVAFGGRLAT